MNNKSGFTLLEIIIVIIIIGVLASLALPRLFSTVEFSRSSEAMNAISAVRSAALRCALLSGNMTTGGCNVLSSLDVGNPGSEAGSHFSYAMTIQNATSTPAFEYTLTATRNTLDGGAPTDFVRVQVSSTGITRSGTGKFVNIK